MYHGCGIVVMRYTDESVIRYALAEIKHTT